MSKVRIPHDAVLFIGDGRKALFLRNAGHPFALKLQTERVMEQDNPATAAQGSDEPGRAFQSVGTARSAMEQTDWHDLEEKRFAHEVAARLDRMARDGRITQLVIAAPPRTLGELRQAMSDEVRAKVVAEIDKDFTRHPVPELEKLLEAA